MPPPNATPPPRGRPAEIDHAELLRLYADPSISVLDIAKQVGCHPSTVRYVARLNGVYLPRSVVPQETRETIAELSRQGVPVEDIKELTGVGTATVVRVRREIGLSIRKRDVTEADVRRFVALVESGKTQAGAAREMGRASPSLRLACVRLGVEIPGKRRAAKLRADEEEHDYFALPDWQRRARLMGGYNVGL